MKQQQCEREAITLLPDDATRADHQIAAVVRSTYRQELKAKAYRSLCMERVLYLLDYGVQGSLILSTKSPKHHPAI